MIYTYSALKGGGFSTLGSLCTHLSMLVAMWVTIEPITEAGEYVDGLTRPRNLMIWLSVVHLLVTLTQALNWFLHKNESMEMVQESLSVVVMWLYLFAIITLFAEYLQLTDETEYRYLFERPLIWQSYVTWMLLEIILFIGAVITTVVFLTIRVCLRAKVSIPVDIRQHDFFRWAGNDVLEEIRSEREQHTDFLLTNKSKVSLIFLSSFIAPLSLQIIVRQTKYFDVLTEE